MTRKNDVRTILVSQTLAEALGRVCDYFLEPKRDGAILLIFAQYAVISSVNFQSIIVLSRVTKVSCDRHQLDLHTR